MNQRRSKRPHGQLRQGQVVSTFGPGAMLDLPNHSVLVAGLEHWIGVGDEIVEPRLADKLRALLDVPSIKLYAPRPDPQDSTAAQTVIGACLRPSDAEQFAEPNRFLISNASYAYFPQLLTVISLPVRDERIKQAVDAICDTLEAVENMEQLRY